MDVDGTLTDGGIYMDGSGNELKRFDVQDGQGIVPVSYTHLDVYKRQGKSFGIRPKMKRCPGRHFFGFGAALPLVQNHSVSR